MNQSHVEPSIGWQQYALVFVLAWLAWLLLVGNLNPQEIVLGGIVALIVTVLSGRHLAVFTGVRFTPMALLHACLFLLSFFRALILANLDMARRVLSPSLPIRPALVEVETRLESSLGKLLLPSAITLTPGTLSVDVHDARLLVHWVDCPPGLDMEEKTQVVVGAFEKHLRGFLL